MAASSAESDHRPCFSPSSFVRLISRRWESASCRHANMVPWSQACYCRVEPFICLVQSCCLPWHRGRFSPGHPRPRCPPYTTRSMQGNMICYHHLALDFGRFTWPRSLLPPWPCLTCEEKGFVPTQTLACFARGLFRELYEAILPIITVEMLTTKLSKTRVSGIA